MADERPTYRPRRAAGGDTPPERQATSGPTTTGSTSTPGTTAPDAAAGAPAGSTAAGSTAAGGTSAGADRGGRFTDDEARPIFREAAADADAATVRTPGGTDGAQPDQDPDPDRGPSTDEQATADAAPSSRGSRRLNFTPRSRPAEDEDATTLLPRTTAGRGAPVVDPDLDDLDDLDVRPRRLGGRARLALLVGAVAAVVVIGLAIGSAVIGNAGDPGAAGDPSAGPATSASASPTPAELLGDASMLAPDGAQPLDPKRTWTVATTTPGPLPADGGPGCLGSNPLEGAPTAQQTISRTLTSSGSGGPTALHVAQAYGTVEDATQAFGVTARALGTCAVTGDWITAGSAVTGVGDQAAAVAVRSVADGQAAQHWVVVSRTGRAIDVVDAATTGRSALDVKAVTATLASVVGAQCATAGGACAESPQTADAPPPAGGDEPGFLATGDLPPVGSTTAPWVGTPTEPPSEDFTGSQCETVSWATTAATTKSSRVYLLQDVPGIFGLNEVTLTVKDAQTASRLVDKIRSDWTSCKERKLTATVGSPKKVSGTAEGGAAVAGWTTEVEQKAGSTTTRFRVGIASSGDKVAFVFLNPQRDLDVSDGAWDVVAVRAVQRLTQQS